MSKSDFEGTLLSQGVRHRTDQRDKGFKNSVQVTEVAFAHRNLQFFRTNKCHYRPLTRMIHRRYKLCHSSQKLASGTLANKQPSVNSARPQSLRNCRGLQRWRPIFIKEKGSQKSV
jgi:hypothetical protein